METVGILAPTGTVIDRLILVSVETVWDVHGIDHEGDNPDHEDEAHEGNDHAHENEAEPAEAQRADVFQRPRSLEPEITALLVSYRSAAGAVRLPGFINRQSELQAAVPAIETTRLLSLLGVGIEGARLFAWLLSVIGGLSIFVALLNAASAREGARTAQNDGR